MKVSRTQLDDLLELGSLDIEAAAKRNQLERVTANPELQHLQQRLVTASSALLDASKVEEAVALELERNSADLQLVEQREKLDRTRLAEAKNAKDAQGLQNELETLAKRREALEDSALELMQAQADAAVKVAEATKVREQIREEGSALSQSVQAEAMKLQSALELCRQDRERLSSRLPADLLALYEKKLVRGTAVGSLHSPQCGACRMTISSSEYAQLQSKPADELIECPECSAILVRL